MNIKLKDAEAAFISKYWTNTPGGINSIGVGIDNHNTKEFGIVVYVESSQQILDSLPDTFMGFPVYKKMIGKIRAL